MTVYTDGIRAAMRRFALDKADRLGDVFVERAQNNAPQGESGKLAKSISHEPAVAVPGGYSVHVTVGAEHGLYQEQGTGIYGPQGTPIRGNPLLAFDWPKAGGLVIVHSVKGSPATHWWSRTIDEWSSIVGAQ